MTTPAYDALTATFTRLYRYQHLAAIASWDQAAMMPPQGNEARSAAMAELHMLMHQTLTDPAMTAQLQAAQQENLTDWDRANLHEMQRDWEYSLVMPAHLVEAKSLAGSRCEHAWRTQRKTHDWQGFLDNFREVVRLSREEAQVLSQAQGLSPYDALMAKYEPGTQSAHIERIFGDVKQWLPGLIQRVRDKQASESFTPAQGPFPVEKQRALGLAVMEVLGFDFSAGRLDVSTHPFCGGVAQDVRITTRYSEEDFMRSMMGVVHETGHARYEQNLPRAWAHLPVGRARSMGIHESQSLAFEMQLGRSPAFLQLIAPLIRQHLGDQSAFEPSNLARIYTRVAPGFIRVDADELCYPAHVILRFEIERALVNDDIAPDDIPALWDEKMMAYLGVDTRGNYRDGCLQDIHWTDGSFGYFPSYTLGAMYAAQYFNTLRQATPDLDAQVARGDLSSIFNWLQNHIWSQASRWATPELVERATGESLNPAHFKRHLEQRYLGI
ncbi:carboxypeptidase M32 [Rhodoferax aquaticus]|uniref:Metal-dependent carboxypeptidase n=1 Tax=Rhodoferax aquaticus TaxID=2527691 RepID=A0A515EVU1_9BURK|nr:carboxypeptidase M32 [Rhodoferax aquaticus]QDL56805.1 carboxypeptidase M32 [Rhodoferax aquaticus]